MRLKAPVLNYTFSLAHKPILEASCELEQTVCRHKLMEIMIFIP